MKRLAWAIVGLVLLAHAGLLWADFGKWYPRWDIPAAQARNRAYAAVAAVEAASAAKAQALAASAAEERARQELAVPDTQAAVPDVVHYRNGRQVGHAFVSGGASAPRR